MAEGGGRAAELRAWADRPPLDARAERLDAALRRRLPPARAARLRTEAGVVEVEGADRGGARRWCYVVALSDLALAACVTPLAEAAPPREEPGWAGERTTIPWEAETTLAPSATLALALHLLDAAPDRRPRERLAHLQVRHTATSPYPPQHHPWTTDGLAAEEQAGADLGFQLFARLDDWAAPLDSLYGARRGNVALADPRPCVSLGRPHVRIDGMEALDAPAGGPCPWRCAWSWIDGEGRAWSGADDLELELDAAALLAQGRGPLGPARPACRRDPIEGDAWGVAPPLAIGRALGALWA